MSYPTPSSPTSFRWLKSSEVLSILTSPSSYSLSLSPHPPLCTPTPGSLYLYDKRQCKRWRYDHHTWRTPERHVKLKVGGQQRINALYSHSQEGGRLSRRGYWLLEDPHTVLVHYLTSDPPDVKGTADERKEGVEGEVGAQGQWVAMPFSPPLTPPFLPHSSPPYPPTPLLSSPPFPSFTPLSPLPTPTLIECSPSWDHPPGGSRLLLLCTHTDLFHLPSLHCIFHSQPLPLNPLPIPGAFTLTCPLSLHPCTTSLYLTDGTLNTPPLPFEYRRAGGSSGAFLLPRTHPSPQPSLPPSTASTPRVSTPPTASPPRELLSSLLSQFSSIERSLLLTPSSSPSTFHSTVTLEDLHHLILTHPSDDLLEGLLHSILSSLTTPFPPKSLTHTDSRGRQLLHLCAALGYIHLLAFLLDASVSIDTPDGGGRTALHYAAQYGDEVTVAAVLSFGADVGVRDEGGRRAVDVAREMGKRRVVEVLEEVEGVEEEERREASYHWEEEEDTDSPYPLSDDPFTPCIPPLTVALPQVLPYTSAPTPSSSFPSLPPSPPHPPTHPTPSLDLAFSTLTLSDMGINTSALHSSLIHPTSPTQFHSLVRDSQRQLRWYLLRRHHAAMKLQAAARGMLVRRSMKRMRDSAVVIQRVVRRRRERRAGGGSADGGVGGGRGVLGRFQGVVEELQERVRRKREAMEEGGLKSERSEGLVEEQGVDGLREESAVLGEAGLDGAVIDPFATDASHAQMMPLSPVDPSALEHFA